MFHQIFFYLGLIIIDQNIYNLTKIMFLAYKLANWV